MLETLLRPFWNAEERRPRALWRLAGGGVAYVLATLALALLLARGPASAWLGASDPVVARTVRVAASAAVTVAVVALAGVALDRRRLADFGLHIDREWWTDLGFGLLLGAVSMTLVFAVEYAFGWVVVTGTFVSGPLGFAPSFLLFLVTFVLVGFYEELLTRGYVLTNVAEGLRLGWPVRVGRSVAVGVAVLVSSALFGFLHAANPSATLVSSLAISFAGVMLAAGYVLTGELAIPIGIHITWNTFQGLVYGLPVSGLDVGVSVLAVRQTGPRILTGGSFGPEAGLVGAGAMLLSLALVVAYVRWRRGEVAVAPIDRPVLRWR